MPTATDIMSRRVHEIDREATISDAVLEMNEHNIQSLIVGPQSATDTYGIMTMRDVVYKVVSKGLSLNEIKVFEVMTKPVIVLLPDLSLKHVARLFANNDISRAPVFDAGKLVGMVSLKDLLADVHLVDCLK